MSDYIFNKKTYRLVGTINSDSLLPVERVRELLVDKATHVRVHASLSGSVSIRTYREVSDKELIQEKIDYYKAQIKKLKKEL